MTPAPGSPTQMVLTGVYLQAEALPLIDGAVMARLAADPRVAGAAPLAFPLESSLANQRVIDRLFESAAATAGAA